MTPGRSRDIGIVGAGWAGLSAAVELTQAGHQVTVYESARQPGGRARAIDADGPVLDNGQHLLIGAYRETLRLMEIVAPGSARNNFLRLPLTLHYPEGIRIRASRLPSPLHLAAALLTARGLSIGEKIAAARFMQSLKQCRFLPTYPDTVSEAIAAQPEKLRRYLWTPLCEAALNTPATQASFRVFARVLKDALSGPRDHSDFLIPARDLSALFPKPAASWLENRGATVLTRTRIKAIAPDAGKWGVQSDANLHQHDAVILAAAPAQSALLLDKLPECRAIAQGLHRLEYQPIVTVYAQYPELPAFPSPLIGWVDPVPLFIFDLGLFTPGKSGLDDAHGESGRIAIVASADGPHLQWDDARWLEEIQTRMGQVFADLPTPRLIRRVTEKRATFSCTPHVYRPESVTPCPGLYLAGDYVAGPYPSTLEGAVLSGVQCARLLINSP